jgi:Sugar (pentulose and hexulose) kinases
VECFVGIDIGTTNCKALIVNEEGRLIKTLSRKTQYKTIGGIQFFDLAEICAFVDDAESEATTLGKLRSVGFSSVGESTVPVSKEGKALFDPVLWSEQSVTANEEEADFIVRENTFSRIGISQNGLLALDKILWFCRNYPEIAKKADCYLPLTSYLVFRKTNQAAWDYSQALRSNAFLVHERCWDENLLSHFGLKPFGRLCPMGTAIGEKNGVVYGLGGHDHITGLYAIHSLMAEKESSFFYESMGTSAVLTLCLGENEKSFSLS